MIRHLLVKEFLQIRRNAFLPKLVFVFPVVIMCVMPWVMDMEVRNVSIVVVDNDHSGQSCRLVEKVKASDYFIFKGLRDTNDEAVRDVELSRADVILTIPQHYGRDLEMGKRPQILISANAVNGTKGSIGASYLAGIIGTCGSEVIRLCGTTVAQRPNNLITSKPYDLMTLQSQNIITELYLYNKHLDYKVFMIPALMSILLMMVCGFLPALNIVSEKECGTIEQINVSPVSRGAFIMAKLIPYWIIGLIVLTICFLLSWLVYGIVPAGSILLLYVISMLLALFFSGLGLVISNYSDTMQQAIFVMWFFVVCMMLLSGLFTPVSSMPTWAQTLTIVDPVRWYIDAMRTVFVRGGRFMDILQPTAILIVMAATLCILAAMSYRKRS